MKTALVVLGTALLVSLSGCARQEHLREIDWAKAALARNPAYEIVATDETAGIFTVRDTVTGSIQTVKVDDLVAGPREARPTSKPAPAPVVEAEPVTPTSTPASTPGPASTAGSTVAAAPQTTEPADVQPQTPSDGVTLAAGPGYRIERAEDAAPAAPPAPTLEGPGYSITRHDADTAPSAPHAEAVAARAADATEPRSDPIICQGERLMRIDGETLSFTGDALIAEEGCDLFITNASIRAGGVGIIARRARVHIVNSTIDGELASYEASDGAELYVTRTTFTGIGRRFDNASMNDLGGNKYESN